MSQLPPLTDSGRSKRAALANARRFRPNDPATEELARDFKAERLADHIREQVESAPRLSDDQREELARILRPAPTLEDHFRRELIDATFGPFGDELEDDDPQAGVA